MYIIKWEVVDVKFTMTDSESFLTTISSAIQVNRFFFQKILFKSVVRAALVLSMFIPWDSISILLTLLYWPWGAFEKDYLHSQPASLTHTLITCNWIHSSAFWMNSIAAPSSQGTDWRNTQLSSHALVFKKLISDCCSVCYVPLTLPVCWWGGF